MITIIIKPPANFEKRITCYGGGCLYRKIISKTNYSNSQQQKKRSFVLTGKPALENNFKKKIISKKSRTAEKPS